MGTRFNKTYILAPLVYGAVIMGLIFFQFAKKSEKFYDSIRDLTLMGVSSAEKAGGPVEELHLRYQGVDFAFGDRSSLEMTTAAGESVKLALLKYQKNERGYTLRFERDLTIDFVLDGKKDGMIVKTSFGSKNPPKVKNIVMRFTVVGGAKANSVERMPIIAVNYKDKDFLLSLTGESSIDMARQKLVLVPGETGETSLSFAPASGGTKDSFRQWYANQGSVTTADVLEKKTADYITGSYEGWKSGRYTPEEGVWLNEKGTKAFSEELVTAYIAESLRRAGSGAVLEEMQKIASMHADMLGFKSSVFFGNLQNLSLRLLRDDEKESARIGALIRSRDSSVFARGDLIQFAADRGSPNLKAEVLKFASEVDLSGLSLTTALGMLRNYYDEKTLDPAVLKTLERFVPLINAKIFPAIIKINEGFFLEIGNGKIDVYLSILGGRILMLAGKAERDPVLEAIGRDLILSSLSLADKQGFLPRNILFSEMTLRGNEGRIAPEDVYPLIVDNPYYPRFISLSKDLGRQAWLYTAANMTSLSFSKERYVIRFRFPEGATHHFIFRGAKPYKEIQIWGIPWRVDSRFERYSTGSYFLENEGIFAVKYRHKKTEEEFLMGFSGE